MAKTLLLVLVLLLVHSTISSSTILLACLVHGIAREWSCGRKEYYTNSDLSWGYCVNPSTAGLRWQGMVTSLWSKGSWKWWGGTVVGPLYLFVWHNVMFTIFYSDQYYIMRIVSLFVSFTALIQTYKYLFILDINMNLMCSWLEHTLQLADKPFRKLLGKIEMPRQYAELLTSLIKQQSVKINIKI